MPLAYLHIYTTIDLSVVRQLKAANCKLTRQLKNRRFCPGVTKQGTVNNLPMVCIFVFGPICENMTSSANRKCTTYCIVIRRGPKPQPQKICRSTENFVKSRHVFFRCTSGLICKQVHRQERISQYFAPLQEAK